MSSGSKLTSKLYDKIIKMLSKSHETIPLLSLLWLLLCPIKKCIHFDAATALTRQTLRFFSVPAPEYFIKQHNAGSITQMLLSR
jgi:hypothetical protein